MPGPVFRVPGSYFVDLDTDGGDSSTFQVQHHAAVPLLKVEETGRVTVYGPIVAAFAPLNLRTNGGGLVVEFLDSSGASVADIDSDGTARFDGGLRLPVDATTLTPTDGLLSVQTGVNVMYLVIETSDGPKYIFAT